MKTLRKPPPEVSIIGHWIKTGGCVVEAEACWRIESLVEHRREREAKHSMDGGRAQPANGAARESHQLAALILARRQ